MSWILGTNDGSTPRMITLTANDENSGRSAILYFKSWYDDCFSTILDIEFSLVAISNVSGDPSSLKNSQSISSKLSWLDAFLNL